MTEAIGKLVRTHRKDMVRFLKFVAVGTLGAIIDFGVLNFGVKVLHLPDLLGESAGKLLSVSCAFTLAVLSNFIWNRLWIYPETRHDPLLKVLGQFTLVNLIGYFINIGIFYSADHWVLGTQGLLAVPVGALVSAVGVMNHYTFSYNAAKILSTGVVLFWNFFVNRVWTFRSVDRAAEPPA